MEVRINYEDSMQDVLIKMSDGNPGALTVMLGLLGLGDQGFLAILALDTYGLYGPDIWVAFKDVCGSEIEELAKRLFDHDESIVSDVKRANMGEYVREPVLS